MKRKPDPPKITWITDVDIPGHSFTLIEAQAPPRQQETVEYEVRYVYGNAVNSDMEVDD